MVSCFLLSHASTVRVWIKLETWISFPATELKMLLCKISGDTKKLLNSIQNSDWRNCKFITIKPEYLLLKIENI